MKKIFSTLMCAVFALTASAQNSPVFSSTGKPDLPVTIGIRGGLNFANFSTSISGISIDMDSRTAFHAGMIVDIPLVKSLYVQPGLFISSKGSSNKALASQIYGGKAEVVYRPIYLELPILASGRIDFSDNLQLQVNFGPYFAYGIGGTSTLKANGIETEGNFFDDDDVNAFDMGLQVGGGLTFCKHIYLGVAYEFGLINIVDDKSKNYYGVSAKNSNFMISLGYNF